MVRRMSARFRIATLVLLGTLTTAFSAAAFEFLPAEWTEELGITRLDGYADNEFLVLSNIAQTQPVRTVRHHLEVKVSAFDKSFTAEEQSPDRKLKETLSITLHPTTDQKHFKAEFEHVVYEDGEVTLRFSGVTILPHW